MSSTITSIRLQTYKSRARLSTTCVFEFSRRSDRLKVWPWPTSTANRVSPSDLPEYRISHRMLGPCCLCPLADPDSPEFVESAIYRSVSGRYKGEYIASCAQNKCGYIVPLERLYSKLGLNVACYPRRADGEPAPPQVDHVSDIDTDLEETATIAHRPLKRTFAMLDVLDLTELQAPASRHPRKRTRAELFEKLDARINPGLTASQFSGIFSQCDCGIVTTRRAFFMHQCSLTSRNSVNASNNRVDIDLTDEL